MAQPGPTANLPGTARRSGRSGKVFRDGDFLGEVTGIEWNVAVAQIAVVMAGRWRNETKPGAEERTGTFTFQDIHDRWSLQVWRFVRARRDGDRSAAAFPEFSIITEMDDVGAPHVTRWQLDGCQLFSYQGGFDTANDLENRQVPFSFRDERPLDAFEYTSDGIKVTQD